MPLRAEHSTVVSLKRTLPMGASLVIVTPCEPTDMPLSSGRESVRLSISVCRESFFQVFERSESTAQAIASTAFAAIVI